MALGTRRIVDRVLDALADAADEVLVIANDAAIQRELPGVPIHTDSRPERGSLIGLYSGVSRAGEAALVVAWDMPFVTAGLLRELRRVGEAGDVAVVPEGPRGPEPLCAYYPRSCAETMHHRIASGALRLSALVDALPTRVRLPLADVARFGDPERLFANINSPLDLEAAARRLDEPIASGGHLTPSGARQ